MKSFLHKLGTLLFSSQVLSCVLLLGSVYSASADTFFETFDRDPQQNGWLLIGDRQSMTWNEGGWLDINAASKVSRLVHRMENPLEKDNTLFFEVDVMALKDAVDSGVYSGAMAPMGNEFKDFLGSASDSNGYPAVICRAGIDVLKGVLTKLEKPYIVRVACAYRNENGKGKLDVKVLNLLNNSELISFSEVNASPDEINFAAMTVFGLGNKITGGTFSQPLRYDNLYFSTSSPNAKPVPPSFINKDLISITSVTPYTTQKSVKVTLNISSLIDVADVEFSGSILPQHKLRGDEIWTGDMGKFELKKNQSNVVEYTVNSLDPKLWSPSSPELYNFTINMIRKGQVLATLTFRFGFREVEVRAGKFFLNGKPLFLRGVALNPPATDVLPGISQKNAFIRDYIRDLKLRNVNIIRMESEKYDDLKNWLTVCDELGMMVFQGRYGIPAGGTEKTPPNDLNATIDEYRNRYFNNFVNHPSVVIYILSSGVGGVGNDQKNYSTWLARVYKKLKKWNPNAVYMANAGMEKCSAGDLEDHHLYEGWYQGSFLGFLDMRNTGEAAVPGEAVRPITLSECVGASPTDKTGFSLRPQQLAPALCWGGNELTDPKTAMNYQSFLMKQAVEQFRRSRSQNPRLSGIMPYTVLYSNWTKVRIFSDMKPKTAADQMRSGFQPVLVSWENWHPNVYAGNEFKTTVHIINDSDTCDDLMNADFLWELTDYYGNIIEQGTFKLPTIKYYSSQSFPLSFKVSPKAEPGVYRLNGTVKQSSRLISVNDIRLFIGNKNFVRKDQSDNSAVRLFDPSGKYAEAFNKLGVKFAELQSFSGLREGNLLILGDALDFAALGAEKESLLRFVKGGGRILCLAPSDELMKLLELDSLMKCVKIDPKSGVFINRNRTEEVLFNGLPPDSGLSFWNDYTDWDESKPGYPQVAPVIKSLRLKNPESLAKVAVLANFGRGLVDIALVQAFVGEGSIVLSCFDFLPRVGVDPVADRMFINLISYDSSKKKHNRSQPVGNLISWGNLKSEKGLASVPETGLLLVTEESKKNMEGPNGHEYFIKGRSISGPFMYNSDNEVFFVGDDLGFAQFLATIPEGLSHMVTKIKNPTDVPQSISIKINDVPPISFPINPGQTGELRSPLPFSTNSLRVVFRGNRHLLLLETRFE